MPARQAKSRLSAQCAAAAMPCAKFPPACVRRLKAYLDRFAGEVQRFFPIPKGSPVEAFDDLAPRYPVLELQPMDEPAQGP
jgi:hypothetical protein